MKTVVETYLIEETVELIYDNEKLDKWNNYVKELGLKGQTEIQVKDKSPIPFMHMKKSMINVFSCLCPRRVDLKSYNVTPIPVEILDLVALSVKEQYFQKIEVWYDDATPDPAVIGSIGNWVAYDRKYNNIGRFNTQDEALAMKDHPDYHNHMFEETAKYLIGRWADVKASIEELTAKARKLFIARKSDELNKKIREAQRDLADLELEANASFGYDGEGTVPSSILF